MKLLKYILVALVFVVTTGEAFGQVKVLSGKVSEMFGSTADPLMGVNINVMNSQNRSLGGTVSNVDGIYNLKIPDNRILLYWNENEENQVYGTRKVERHLAGGYENY